MPINLTMCVGFILAIPFIKQKIELQTLLAFVFVYGIALFIFLSELLMYFGLGHWLTEKRGTKWVKEIDYIYLLMGTTGIAASLNRLDIIQGKLSGVDLIGPLILVTAVVIRLIKTRAEINEWQKL